MGAKTSPPKKWKGSVREVTKGVTDRWTLCHLLFTRFFSFPKTLNIWPSIMEPVSQPPHPWISGFWLVVPSGSFILIVVQVWHRRSVASCGESDLKSSWIYELYQWDFQGPPIMGPPYGKLPILFPYHSHTNPQRYENSMGSLPQGGPIIGGPWNRPWLWVGSAPHPGTWVDWMVFMQVNIPWYMDPMDNSQVGIVWM